MLAGYGLQETDAIEAIRTLRSGLHGFITLEASGAFGLPIDVDRSFDRMVGAIIGSFSHWSQ